MPTHFPAFLDVSDDFETSKFISLTLFPSILAKLCKQYNLYYTEINLTDLPDAFETAKKSIKKWLGYMAMLESFHFMPQN